MPEDSRKPPDAPEAASAREGAVEVETVPADETLEDLEERVLRALTGRTVADEAPLPQKGEGMGPAVRARLLALEQQAFERAGRREALREEAEAEATELERRDAVRARIVAALEAQGDVGGDDPRDPD